jgi:hypothetical protein
VGGQGAARRVYSVITLESAHEGSSLEARPLAIPLEAALSLHQVTAT